MRHLVLPGGNSATARVRASLADEVSRDTYINLMDPYHPCHRAGEYPKLGRTITRDEYRQALATAKRRGLNRLDRVAPKIGR